MMKHRLYAFLLLTLALMGCNSFSPSNSNQAPSKNTAHVSTTSAASAVIELADSSANSYAYGYAPAIIYTQGQYHAYYCSTGSDGTLDWDNIRHITSSDMVTWSAPVDILKSTPIERANCDPSIVYFDAGDGPFYYLFYSGNAKNVQTLNFVSRSKSPDGPFLKFTDRGTWEAQPSDSHAIVWPFQNSKDGSGIYGAGQASVVVKDGNLYMWYTDTTATLPNQVSRIYLRVSNNATSWSSPIETTISNGSVDVKYDPIRGQFVLFEILNEHMVNAELAMTTSQDGINWSDATVICDQNCFPHWSNNIGVSGDDQGHLIGNSIMAAFGAPYGLSSKYNNDCKVSPSPNCWGHWSVYGLEFNLSLGAAPASRTPGAGSCVAPQTSQTYLTQALTYFSGAASDQAATCRDNLANVLVTLNALGWPCDSTSTTVTYVSSCVSLVQQSIGQTPASPDSTSASCVAPASDQTYLKTAVQFFNEAANTSAASQALICNANLESVLPALQASNWPCATTASAVQYVSTCVGLVHATASGH